jgi:hypothetical protein
MALDVTAYTHLVPITREEALEPDGALREDCLHAFNTEVFASKGTGLASEYYRVDLERAFTCFCIGQIGYGWWREQLAEMLGYTAITDDEIAAIPDRNGRLAATALPRMYRAIERAWQDPDDPGPFGDLFYFTDCDGTLGPVAATRLAADFAAHRDAAVRWNEAHPAPEGRIPFLQYYDAFRRVVGIVADADTPALVRFA